jgi:hypothetical protein
VTFRDLRSGGAATFELEQDEGGSGDPGGGRGAEADPAQGLESDLQQEIGTFGDSVDASDHGIERLSGLGEFTALCFLTGWRKPGPAFS